MRLLAVIVITLLAFVDPAFAESYGSQSGAVISDGGFAILGIAAAAVGGALSQSKTVSTALESIGRNPGAAGQMFLPWLFALVFIESLVIYALVIALKLVGII